VLFVTLQSRDLRLFDKLTGAWATDLHEFVSIQENPLLRTISIVGERGSALACPSFTVY
jgi:hypothetical protein